MLIKASVCDKAGLDEESTKRLLIKKINIAKNNPISICIKMSNVTAGNSSSLSTGITFAAKLELSYQYIGFGLIDAFVNLFVLFLCAFNRGLLKRFAFIFGFAVGDALSGVSLFVSGLIRMIRLNDNTINSLVHPSVCMSSSQLNLFSSHILAAMFFFIGMERSIAVWYFRWYHKKWTDKMSWLGNLCILGFALASLSVAYIIAFSQPTDKKITYDCSLPTVVGVPYTVYHVALGAVGGTMAFIPTLASFVVFYKRKKLMDKQDFAYSEMFMISVNKNLKVTKLLLILAILDMSLVAIPNLLQILYLYNVVPLAAFSAWLLQIQCLRGSVNVFIYFFTNEEFRVAILKIVRYKNANEVLIITSTNPSSSRL